ncbi:MAG TPA: CehA/McbA family metallohydrolase, partial [Candidatus Glassbacteria bacterium]|nr:CehA/McbA family metallohydrolase [Candidatus Glassbacteria bacterium]
PASATVCVNDGLQEPDDAGYRRFGLRYSANRLKGPIRFRPLKYYFYTDGRFEVRVPPGTAKIEAGKGYEYLPATVQVQAGARDTVDVTVKLERWIDMTAAGWYSGDTHIHMERTGANDDTLLALTSARDIRYAYLLSMNTDGYARGGQYEGWLQAKGLGERSVARSGGYFISSGQEYRSGQLGHVTIILPDEYVPGPDKPSPDVSRSPSLGVIADQTHRLNGFIGLAHGGYYRTETDGLLLDGKLDFLELLQFGGYRSLGLDGWYDFLNVGFRLPIVGACDYPYTRELGSEITYAWCDSQPTPRSWAQRIAKGQSFATSGPMLFLQVNGCKPGEIISLPAGGRVRFSVDISVESDLYPVSCVELIANGWVITREYFEQPRASYQFTQTVDISESTWIAARAYAGAGTEAHTNPVYIYVGGKRPFNRDSARNIVARLEASAEAITGSEVLERLGRAKAELKALLDGHKSSLPLPTVPAN